MEFASKFVEKVIDVGWNLTIRHVGYIINYRKNVTELKGLVADLEDGRKSVKQRVDTDTKNLRTIKDEVTKWIGDVDEATEKAIKFKMEEWRTETGCSSGLLPYLWNRHRLSRKAKKMADDQVKPLIVKSQFGEVSNEQTPTFLGSTMSNVDYQEFGSRKETREKIMKKLEDSTVRMIGVHGPGGVGKSTLVNEIANEVQGKLFNVVVKVDVTDNPNLPKIQEEIAYVLGLRLEGESETLRADRLRRRLKKLKENTLIILDDLWDEFDLYKIGISFDDDDDDDDLSHMTTTDMKDPSFKMVKKDMKDPNFKMAKKGKSLGNYKGCKILLTSRDQNVLSDKMKIDDKSIFPVEELKENESLELFKKVAEMHGEMPIQDIVKYCAGLPIAIFMVGRTLRDKSKQVWESTLEKLKKEELSGVHKPMEISLKMSYEHLESEELKSIFLLCAQMGRQQLIMDLVNYCFGLGILKGIYTISEAKDRIGKSIKKLIKSSLMVKASSDDRFDMHDMIRDAALSIAQREQNVFALRNGKLDDWHELEKCTAISIRNCDIIDELPKLITCPQLKFFQIDSDDPSLKIPENFFEGMEKLRVLILTGFHFPSLPSSIKCLLNLRMLCLERCILVDNLSIIGELKKLKILSFSGSQIKNLPHELGCLGKLQLFDISNCSIAEVVPPSFISRLICLEELYIRKSMIKMEVDGETNQNQFSFLSQLKHLHHLRVVDLYIPSATVLPADLFFDKLNDYKIVIGNIMMLSIGDFRMPKKYETSRSLALRLIDGIDIHSQEGIKLLFKGVKNLLLGELNGVKNVFCELNVDGFPYLKHLSIVNNIGIEYIFNSMELSHPKNAFPNLESISLYKSRTIKTICYTPITDASFAKLKTIKVKMCNELKNLFSFYVAKFLVSLETIDVSECYSLEEIVVKEGQASSNKVEFHKLCSLTLHSLPSFTSFYANIEMPSIERQATNLAQAEITIAEDDHSVVEPLTLFDVLVEVPNLESLELSSISSHNIWSDQPLSSSYFQNLTKLIVTDCHNLRYLCSFSMANSLKELKVLFISECHMMEKIFITKGNSVDKVSVFPKLEEIRLTKLDMLTDICQAEVSVDSFSSLTSVQIEKCKKLDKIFPSHLTGWFHSLESLKVVDCRAVEFIFGIKNSHKKDASVTMTDTKLQLLFIKNLHKLTHIWDRDPEGIIGFKNLQSIQVAGCDELGYVLPASVAKDLKSLQSISVGRCKKMEEIVAWEDGSETSLNFPEVNRVQLFLLSIRHFYSGGHIECPNLKELSVIYCENLETFTMETMGEEKPVLYAEKVIFNLEILEIDSKEALRLLSNHGKHLMYHLKDLTVRWLRSIEDLYWLRHRMPNLKSLTLLWDLNIEELVPPIVPQERLGTILQLEKLSLRGSDIKNLRLDRDPILQRLEHLMLDSCYYLINLGPSSVSLTHLTYLEVSYCPELTNLMTSSTARSMVQLATMKLIHCRELKEIVSNEGNEEGGVIEAVFSKLVSIELVRLKNLTSFCPYKNWKFKFPSLERLIVTECPKLEIFTKCHTTTPKLQNILVIEGEEEEKGYWEGDLNATIQKVFKDKVTFQYTKHLDISDYPEMLKQAWHRNDLVHENMFCNLKTLKIWYCRDLVHAIPSHLLHCFENLEELEVSYCSEVQVIFNINDMRLTKALGTFRLKTLSLYDLPSLKHVWDKDPIGIFCLQVLQKISVGRCDTLKSLFPASVAKDFSRLENLKVTNCKELVEIFSKDEMSVEGATKEFVFPCLSSLDLTEMAGLKYFYPGLHKVECPMLQELHAYKCNLVVLNCQEDHPRDQSLVQVEKVIQTPNFIRILSFGIGDTKVTWSRESHKLQFDELQLFQQESGSVLFRFLVMLHKIEKLELSNGSFEEMFSVERPNADYNTVLLHLKELELIDLANLKSIGLEHSWLHTLTENLQTLKVRECALLISLVPHTVSFSNLTHLHVIRCESLLYLLTSSTAKSLCRLKEMKIQECKSMQEILSTEGEESHEDGKILFEQLHTLYLEDLPELRCFYSGIFSLCFPSLKRVFVIGCRWMETFCPDNTIDSTKLSSGVTLTFTDDDDDETSVQQLEGDLNSILQKRFEEMISFKKTTQLDFSYYPKMLEQVWNQNHMVHESMFCYLKTLRIVGSHDLVHAIPSHLLPCFGNLEELAVEDCSKMQVIFNLNDMRVTEALGTFRLKKLSLCFLPKLEHVWDKDPVGIFCLPMLQEIIVERCHTLKSLFPASVAKDLTSLEMLKVSNCNELVEIFSTDEMSAEGATKEFVFPCLTSLKLTTLPALKHFYPGLHMIECPTLQELYHCNLVIVGCQENHPGEQALIQIEKVVQIPNMEILSFGIRDTEVTWSQGSGELQFKKSQSFHEESDSVVYKLLVMLPNMEKLKMTHGWYEEIFPAERPNGNETRVLLSLKELELIDLGNLKSIGLEHSWLHPVPENLQVMKIESCGRLINLVPHTVSFSNLTHLHVTRCASLLYLLTSSTAKSLCLLKEMRVEGCESMQEIVSTDGDESHEDEKMIFGQLLTLFLKDLTKLMCFYPGNLALCFPSLENLSVIRCKEMKTFCPFNELDQTKLSSGVTLKDDDDGVDDEPSQWGGDLNSTLWKRFEEKQLQMATSSSVDMINDLNDSKLLWKIAVRIVRIWYIQKPPKPGHVEMILMDSKGDKIQAAVKNDEFTEWNERLKENTTYVMYKFMLLPNGLQFKSCEHPYTMQFTIETILKEKDFPEIPFFEYRFKSFSDILAGKYQPDLLVDVIGFVDENDQYSQPLTTSKIVMFKMKDSRGDVISCTLWDGYAMKFLNYNHQRQNDGPIIIMLTNARIKNPKGKYPASISNSYYGTKLFINDDIPEIQDFKTRLGANEQDWFMFDAHVKSISEIVGISSVEEVTCVTVGTTAMFINREEGWYYEGCMKCTKRADVPNVPYQCTAPQCLNYNETTIPRYKVDIIVVHKQGSDAKFVFWDHQCAEIIGMTALELRDRMLQEDEDDDLKTYPPPLDLMLRRTMAFRVKVQSVYNQSSVNKFSEDRQLIKRILDQIESTQEISKTDKGKSIAIDSTKVSKHIKTE